MKPGKKKKCDSCGELWRSCICDELNSIEDGNFVEPEETEFDDLNEVIENDTDE